MANERSNACIACSIESIARFSEVFDNSLHTCEKGTGTTSSEGEYTFDNYQEDTGTTAIYPNAGGETTLAVSYCIFGLTGEAGEIANKWKKYFRDAPNQNDNPVLYWDFYHKLRSDIIDELGDVLWYCARLATELGVSLGEGVAAENIRKLTERKKNNKIHGSGDNR